MKLYASRPNANMSFGRDGDFREALNRHISPLDLDVIIETGTFLGTGSTRTLAEFFKSTPPKAFTTIEGNWSFFQQAKTNLRAYDFVECRWGRTVKLESALDFVRSDPAIKNHHLFPDIWIDDVVDPAAFYTAELQGKMLHQRPQSPLQKLKAGARAKVVDFAKWHNIGNIDFLWAGENLLSRLCLLHQAHRPLIVLDSAGGIGYLEFQIVENTMRGSEYVLILDDINHLKHFRSRRDIEASPDFKVLCIDDDQGWMMARHIAAGD